jgi:hypothetical protein
VFYAIENKIFYIAALHIAKSEPAIKVTFFTSWPLISIREGFNAF